MKRYGPFILILLMLLVFCDNSFSQCAMCQAQVETARDAGSSVAEGVNKGVLYIFMMPYLIIATIGYYWWRAKKRAAA